MINKIKKLPITSPPKTYRDPNTYTLIEYIGLSQENNEKIRNILFINIFIFVFIDTTGIFSYFILKQSIISDLLSLIIFGLVIFSMTQLFTLLTVIKKIKYREMTICKTCTSQLIQENPVAYYQSLVFCDTCKTYFEIIDFREEYPS